MRHTLYLRCLLVAGLFLASVWLGVPNAAPGAARSHAAPTPRRPDGRPPISPENAGRLAELARLGNGAAGEVILSPDGGLLAVASSLGVYVYDAVTLHIIRLLETDDRVVGLDFSPDGTTLAVGLAGQVQLWWAPDGGLQRRLQGCPGYAATFSPDGRTLAAGGRVAGERGRFVGLLCLWQVSDGTILHRMQGQSPWGFQVNSVAFSPDGQLVASNYDDDTVRVWHVADGSPAYTLTGHSKDVLSVAFSPKGTLLATGSEDGSVRLWQASYGAVLLSLDQQAEVRRVTFSSDGEGLIVEVRDGPARLWRVADGAFLGNPVSKRVPAGYRLISGKEGAQLVLTHSGGALRLWRVVDGTPLGTLQGHYAAPVNALAFAPDGATLASATANMIWLWQIADLVRLRTLEGHPYWVTGLAFSPDGARLLSASLVGASPIRPAMLRLWRVADGEPVWTFRNLMPTGRSIALSPDGKTYAFSIGRNVELRYAADQTPLHSLTEHKERVGPLAFSPLGSPLAVGDGPVVRLWRVTDGLLQHTLRGCKTDLLSLAFSPDGRLLAGGAAGEICVWRMSDGLLLYRLQGRFQWVSDLAFSPDNELLAGAGYDRTIRLWQAKDGTLLRVLTGHTDTILSLAFSPDGRLLASGSEDGTARLWGVPYCLTCAHIETTEPDRPDWPVRCCARTTGVCK